ncbi:MAG: sensor histidine kinase [Methyloversatilis sp.]|uniref:sensor histidine kinase n=1 Tax=Methyloversatilis sp. TaxID=2569862 RepID=UPI001A3A8AB7|nr:sensor histidine kinase [Methyloversatilis sp.]MBL8475216.1 sensor histidine kinase [Methyloversatilis sp.]
MSDAERRTTTGAERRRVITEGLSRAARKAESATGGAERLTDSVLMRLARFRWGALLVVAVGIAFTVISETTFQSMQRAREEIDASRLSLAALNDLVFDNAQVTMTEARYIEEPSVDHLQQHLIAAQRLASAADEVVGWAMRRQIDPERIALVRSVSVAEAEELKRLRALPADASPVEVMDVFLPPVVAQEPLRDALEPLVKTERAYLEEQMALLGEEIEHQRSVAIAVVAIGVLLLILLLRAYSMRSQVELATANRLREARDELDALVRVRTEELSELASHLQTEAERQKSSLARELHDELGSILTASRMEASMLLRRARKQGSPDVDSLARVCDILEQGVQIKRRVIEGLVPTVLTHLGLLPALEALADETRASAPFELVLQLPDALELDRDRGIAIYRVVQEALTNIRKHAQASRVTITLSVADGKIALEIVDDGVGIAAGSRGKTGSHGLLGMKYRADALGGSFRIGPAPGRGTQLSLSLPLPAGD